MPVLAEENYQDVLDSAAYLAPRTILAALTEWYRAREPSLFKANTYTAIRQVYGAYDEELVSTISGGQGIGLEGSRTAKEDGMLRKVTPVVAFATQLYGDVDMELPRRGLPTAVKVSPPAFVSGNITFYDNMWFP